MSIGDIESYLDKEQNDQRNAAAGRCGFALQMVVRYIIIYISQNFTTIIWVHRYVLASFCSFHIDVLIKHLLLFYQGNILLYTKLTAVALTSK